MSAGRVDDPAAVVHYLNTDGTLACAGPQSQTSPPLVSREAAQTTCPDCRTARGLS